MHSDQYIVVDGIRMHLSEVNEMYGRNGVDVVLAGKGARNVFNRVYDQVEIRRSESATLFRKSSPRLHYPYLTRVSLPDWRDDPGGR